MNMLAQALQDPIAAHVEQIVRHLGEDEIADRISRALVVVLGEDQIRTRDLGGTASTAEFTSAVCRRL